MAWNDKKYWKFWYQNYYNRFSTWKCFALVCYASGLLENKYERYITEEGTEAIQTQIVKNG